MRRVYNFIYCIRYTYLSWTRFYRRASEKRKPAACNDNISYISHNYYYYYYYYSRWKFQTSRARCDITARRRRAVDPHGPVWYWSTTYLVILRLFDTLIITYNILCIYSKYIYRMRAAFRFARNDLRATGFIKCTYNNNVSHDDYLLLYRCRLV